MLQHAQETGGADFPKNITEEEFKAVKKDINAFEDWYVGLVRFCATFGCNFNGGYGRRKTPNKRGTTPPEESITNIKKQIPNLAGIEFKTSDYLQLPHYKNCLIYCDPPYKGTTKYFEQRFNYDEYYAWLKEMAQDNIIICSESYMPDEFKTIWHRETKCKFNCRSDKPATLKIENLYLVNTNLPEADK